MNFMRLLALLSGTLLLLFSGGFVLFGVYNIGTEIARSGRLFPRGEFVLVILMIAMALTILAGLAGWLLIEGGRGRLTNRTIDKAGVILGYALLTYAAIFIYLGFDFYTITGFDTPRNRQWFYIFAAWVFGLGVPGWLILRWSRRR